MIIITRLFVIREQYKEQYDVISISHTIPMWELRIKMKYHQQHSFDNFNQAFNISTFQKSGFDLICTYSGFYNSITGIIKTLKQHSVFIEMLIRTENYNNFNFILKPAIYRTWKCYSYKLTIN